MTLALIENPFYETNLEMAQIEWNNFVNLRDEKIQNFRVLFASDETYLDAIKNVEFNEHKRDLTSRIQLASQIDISRYPLIFRSYALFPNFAQNRRELYLKKEIAYSPNKDYSTGIPSTVVYSDPCIFLESINEYINDLTMNLAGARQFSLVLLTDPKRFDKNPNELYGQVA